MSLPFVFNRAPLAFLPVVLALASACTKPNPDYCDSTTLCPGRRMCQPETNRCVPLEVDAAVASEAGIDVALDIARDLTPDVGVDVRPSDALDSCFTADDCTTPDKPTCIGGVCGRCVDDTACTAKSAAAPACDTTAGACVECTEDKHCAATGKPICDPQTRKCVRCTADAQCVKKLNGPDPGVCMFHEDGRCASLTETVFVQSTPQCVTTVGAGGTAIAPYCLPQDGITAALAGNKALVIVRGPTDRWTFSSNGKLTVVGQAGAKVVGAGVGVRVSGGELYLRGLTVSVSGATGTGIVAENGALLRMNRCLVENNGAGGISVNNAAFDITNTVIAGNDPVETAAGTGITFGGIYLNAAAGKTQRFLNNTVVNNKAIGLYCAAAYPVKGLLVSGNAVKEFHQCAPVSSKTMDPPQFDPARPYHLTAASPCVNMGDPMEFPTDDYDGDPRTDPRSDCGADEFKP